MFKDFIDNHKWTFAKTMPQFPHRWMTAYGGC
jgi:hypothetical protein